jgi:protease I
MHIACVLGPGFEDSEFRVPYDRFRAAGHQVTIVGLDGRQALEGAKGKETIKTDVGIDDVRADLFDALFIPGGQSPDKLRVDPRMVTFVRGFKHKPKLVICHGPQLLITADMYRDHRLTAWSTIQGDLQKMGADVVDEAVVVDGDLVTSRKPEDLEAFVEASLGMLQAGAQPSVSV